MLTLISPAKINLFLRVLNRRPDGYHELASLFQAIDLHDILTFTLSAKDSLACSCPSLPTGKSNLIWKAIDIFRENTGLKFQVHCQLQKHIPMQAGLGGGSSNAATALFAVNELLGRPASHAELIKWSARIGSDVAFFLSQGTAYCTGRGECLRPLLPMWQEDFWVVKNLPGLSTPRVYQALKPKLFNQLDPEFLLNSFILKQPIYCNDLEGAALSLMPQLANQREALLQLGFKSVFLAGSGTSFICVGRPLTGYIPKELAHFALPARPLQRTASNWYTLSPPKPTLGAA